jgi:transcriptional regulator with XRE-family HTH domain
MKRPSSRDVALRAGVSQATVSHVINGERKLRVSPATRERVLQAIEELGYQPNATARALRTQRTQLAALLTPDLANPFYPILAQAIQDVLQEHGFELLIANSRGTAARERHFLDTVVQRGTDGAIVVAWHLDRADIERVLQAGVALVSVGSDFGHEGLCTVASRDHRGAAEAVRYLIRKGHRRIAHIAGDQATPPGRLRLAGYRRAMEAAGLPVDESLLVYGDLHVAAPHRSPNACWRRMRRPARSLLPMIRWRLTLCSRSKSWSTRCRTILPSWATTTRLRHSSFVRSSQPSDSRLPRLDEPPPNCCSNKLCHPWCRLSASSSTLN